MHLMIYKFILYNKSTTFDIELYELELLLC